MTRSLCLAVMLLSLISPVRAARPLGAVVAANSSFAFDLYGELRGGDENLFFSPYSVFVALNLAYVGADGQTAAELREVLGAALPEERWHGAVSELNRALQPAASGSKPPYTLAVANALWGQRGYAFLPGFTTTLSERYDAGLREVDFADPEPARETINRWVEEKTERRIKDLIPQGALSDLTRLVLTNAVYFKADWETVFADGFTQPKPFNLPSGETVAVPMMVRPDTETRYYRGEDYQAVLLPYRGGGAEMLILLPDAGAFAAAENRLNAVMLGRLEAQLSAEQVVVELPKFKLEPDAIDLVAPLRALGLEQAFARPPEPPECRGSLQTSSVADFSAADGTRCLFLSSAVHKAFVEVDEQGTEAAAATALSMDASQSVEPEPIRLLIDRPFIFLIRDTETRTLLFMGRVLELPPAE